MVKLEGKNAFWQALVFTIFIFAIGFILGYFLEVSRTSKVETNLFNSEISLLDQQVRTKTLENLNISCELSIKSLFDFADSIYYEALKLERYDYTNKFTNSLKILHKRYDLLRMMLWTDSIELKKRCAGKFHTFVYFYDYDSKNIKQQANQSTYSRLLIDIKNKYPNEVLLIPIAANMKLHSVNVALDSYQIKSVPVIIVDEKIVIKDIPTFEELEKIILQSNK